MEKRRSPLVVREKRIRDQNKVDHRRELYRNQRGRCCYCNCRMLLRDQESPRSCTIDHIVPRSRGGTDHIDNLVAACRECNEAKGDKMVYPTGVISETVLSAAPAPSVVDAPPIGRVVGFIPLPPRVAREAAIKASARAGRALNGLPPEPTVPDESAAPDEFQAALDQLNLRRNAVAEQLGITKPSDCQRPALIAESERLNELGRELKRRKKAAYEREWLREKEERARAGGIVNLDNPTELLHAAFHAIGSIAKRIGWDQLTVEEQAARDAIQRYLWAPSQAGGVSANGVAVCSQGCGELPEDPGGKAKGDQP